MNANQACALLLAQHDQLRNLLGACRRLARRRAGALVTEELDRALERLGEAIAAHNRTEIGILADLDNGPASWATLAFDQVLLEQVAAHTAFVAVLRATPAEETQRILELADEIEAHMAEEERTFLRRPPDRDGQTDAAKQHT